MVDVIKRTTSEKPIIEGRAKVLAVEDAEPCPMCRVIFTNGDVAHRRIDPEMQNKPESLIQQMLDAAYFANKE